jgi:hypothetical protein
MTKIKCFHSLRERVTFLCSRTAPQERREQRSWRRSRGGQDARSQEGNPKKAPFFVKVMFADRTSMCVRRTARIVRALQCAVC